MAAIGVSRFWSNPTLSEARTAGNLAHSYRAALTATAVAPQSLDWEETRKAAPHSHVHLYYSSLGFRGADHHRRVDRRVHGIARPAWRPARRDFRTRGFYQAQRDRSRRLHGSARAQRPADHAVFPLARRHRDRQFRHSFFRSESVA